MASSITPKLRRQIPTKDNKKPRCSNCICYWWTCDIRNMKVCARCKAVSYCSQICQLEHFNKTHMKTCKYLAGIKVKEKSIHTNKTCPNCKVARKLAPKEFENPNSGAYPCIFEDGQFREKKNKETNQKQIVLQRDFLRPDLSDTFLFVDLGEISGKFTLPTEQCLSMLAHTCLKLMYTTPECRLEIMPLIEQLARLRETCWHMIIKFGGKTRLVSRHLHYAIQDANVSGKLSDMCKRHSDADDEREVKWWVSIKILLVVMATLRFIYEFGFTTPTKDEILKAAQQVLDAVSTRMPPFKELLKTLCGGDVRKTCLVCETDITVEDFGSMNHGKGELQGVITLGMNGLQTTCRKCAPRVKGFVFTISEEGVGMPCHNCEKSCSSRPRCKYCQSKGYCSEDCRTEDWEIHKMFCESIQKAAAEGEMGRKISKRDVDRFAVEKIGHALQEQRISRPEREPTLQCVTTLMDGV